MQYLYSGGGVGGNVFPSKNRRFLNKLYIVTIHWRFTEHAPIQAHTDFNFFARAYANSTIRTRNKRIGRILKQTSDEIDYSFEGTRAARWEHLDQNVQNGSRITVRAVCYHRKESGVESCKPIRGLITRAGEGCIELK